MLQSMRALIFTKPSSCAVNPFVTTQVQAVIEGIRLLETFVTAPLGLYSDIKMLRESLPLPEAEELPREETQQRRVAYSAMTDAHLDMALVAIASIGKSLDVLSGLKGSPDGQVLKPEWVAQARRVLARAEQRVGGDIRADTASRIQGLYVIIDPEATNGRPVVEIAEATLRGGTRALQLRDKTHDKGDVLAAARQIKSLCDQHEALFVMNDDADIAMSSEAHGLHVGQTDLPVVEARRILAPGQLVGRSNGTVEEAVASQAQGVDYLAVGAVYPTTTLGKSDRAAVGVETVSKVKGLVSQPVVAIGGIDTGNIGEVVRAGADCVCVVSAVTLADDPEDATRRLVEAFENAR